MQAQGAAVRGRAVGEQEFSALLRRGWEHVSGRGQEENAKAELIGNKPVSDLISQPVKEPVN